MEEQETAEDGMAGLKSGKKKIEKIHQEKDQVTKCPLTEKVNVKVTREGNILAEVIKVFKIMHTKSRI